MLRRAVIVAAAVIGAGAYVRWAVTPVLPAYRIGDEAGRVRGGH
jgi:hypothetical protein